MPTIIISSSPEMGLNDQSDLENVALEEFEKVFPAPVTIQVVHPLEQAAGQSDKAKYTQAGRKRPLLPDRMLLNSYLLPRNTDPPMDEVRVPRPEGTQEIINRWSPFNRGESLADRLHELYPMMLWMPVVVRAGGGGKAKSIPSQSLLVLLKKISNK